MDEWDAICTTCGVWSGKYGYGHRSGVFDIPRITKFGVRHDIWSTVGDMANGKGLLAGLVSGAA